MNETTKIVIESLTETIKNLRLEVFILKNENERLKEEKKDA
jgi:FtsZ-binding cell division protein ZapB